VGYLPEPQEATLGILRQITDLAKSPESLPRGEVKVTLSALEAPSSRLACEIGIAALGLDLNIPFTITAVQKPDPRLPRRTVRYQVWKYKEEKKLLVLRSLTTEPIAAVPEPPPEVATAVAEIARSPFDRPAWLAAGGELVRRLQPNVEELLGVMAHPPVLPSGVYAPIWIQRLQVAAALALANHEAHTPWPDSRRKQVLFDLACGPMDWTVDAAVIALTAVAQNNPGTCRDAVELFLGLLNQQPRPGHVCYEHAVVHCFQQLPGLAKELRDSLAAYQRQMEGNR
jgi:hypothetical protein